MATSRDVRVRMRKHKTAIFRSIHPHKFFMILSIHDSDAHNFLFLPRSIFLSLLFKWQSQTSCSPLSFCVCSTSCLLCQTGNARNRSLLPTSPTKGMRGFGMRWEKSKQKEGPSLSARVCAQLSTSLTLTRVMMGLHCNSAATTHRMGLC